MAHPIAFCSNCGLWFEYHGLTFINSTGVTFEETTTDCPRCDHPRAEILDGTYDFLGDVIKVVNAPEATFKSLEKLRRILREAYSKVGTPEDLAQEIEENAPEFSKLVNLLRDPAITNAIAIITLLITVLSFYQSSQKGSTEINNHLHIHVQPERVVERVYETSRFDKELADKIVNEFFVRCGTRKK